MVVTGIATQGLGQEWITKYRMFAADDAGNYKSIEVRRPYDSDPSPTLRSEELLATSRRENYYLTILWKLCERVEHKLVESKVNSNVTITLHWIQFTLIFSLIKAFKGISTVA